MKQQGVEPEVITSSNFFQGLNKQQKGAYEAKLAGEKKYQEKFNEVRGELDAYTSTGRGANGGTPDYKKISDAIQMAGGTVALTQAADGTFAPVKRTSKPITQEQTIREVMSDRDLAEQFNLANSTVDWMSGPNFLKWGQYTDSEIATKMKDLSPKEQERFTKVNIILNGFNSPAEGRDFLKGLLKPSGEEGLKKKRNVKDVDVLLDKYAQIVTQGLRGNAVTEGTVLK